MAQPPRTECMFATCGADPPHCLHPPWRALCSAPARPPNRPARKKADSRLTAGPARIWLGRAPRPHPTSRRCRQPLSTSPLSGQSPHPNPPRPPPTPPHGQPARSRARQTRPRAVGTAAALPRAGEAPAGAVRKPARRAGPAGRRRRAARARSAAGGRAGGGNGGRQRTVVGTGLY
jgi:hypothetical protein